MLEKSSATKNNIEGQHVTSNEFNPLIFSNFREQKKGQKTVLNYKHFYCSDLKEPDLSSIRIMDRKYQIYFNRKFQVYSNKKDALKALDGFNHQWNTAIDVALMLLPMVLQKCIEHGVEFTEEINNINKAIDFCRSKKELKLHIAFSKIRFIAISLVQLITAIDRHEKQHALHSIVNQIFNSFLN